MSQLKLHIENEVARITLTNPPQNRLSVAMAEELAAAVAAVRDAQVRALLIDADGPDFCFGGDIMPWPDMTPAELRVVFERWIATFDAIENLPFPTIAAVQGTCFGGGLELATRCDIIVATDTARFGHPEQTLGIITMLGGVYRVAERAGRQTAAIMAFTSDPVPAQVMQQRGLVNTVVPEAELQSHVAVLLMRFATGPTRAHAVHKALLRAWASDGVKAADDLILDLAMPLFDTEDVKTGIRSAVDAAKAGLPRPVLHFKGK